MSRTYPELHMTLRKPKPRNKLLALGLGFFTLLTPLPAVTKTIFDSQPLHQERFVVLAQAVGKNRWKLLVIEQIKHRPLCWKNLQEDLVEPTLNNFNFAGICNRYLNSNNYSLRSSGEDVARRFRLRISKNKQSLELKGFDANQAVPITVAKAILPKRNQNGFVKLKLEPGWKLERRTYQGRTLKHIYFAHPDPVNLLIAKASASQRPAIFDQLGAPSAPLPPKLTNQNRSVMQGKGPIRLVVIPYRQ
ncbi:MAG: DUF3747 domain-containing protein [Prochlorococcus sp.]|nr:DUF3747 domain-containing protein [Prochlorococcaceae cyanobacterium ETNP18_MAG_14]MDP6309769.1 DUF3747 domain-containing protein [Prochlorococcaceae cyanobacterium ETNP14_MAG_4]